MKSHHTDRQKAGVTIRSSSTYRHRQAPATQRTATLSALEDLCPARRPHRATDQKTDAMTYPIEIEVLRTLTEGGSSGSQGYRTCDSNTPRASRSVAPAPRVEEIIEEKIGGGPLTLKNARKHARRRIANTRRTRHRPPPPSRGARQINDLTHEQGSAVRRAVRANRVVKKPTPTPMMHTRGQNDPATKAIVRVVTNEVTELKQMVHRLFRALAEKGDEAGFMRNGPQIARRDRNVR